MEKLATFVAVASDTGSEKERLTPFGLPRVAADRRVGAVVSGVIVKTAGGALVAALKALVTTTTNVAPSSLVRSTGVVKILELAPGIFVKPPEPLLRCHWKKSVGAPVEMTLKVAVNPS